jgi:hypothetical protein
MADEEDTDISQIPTLESYNIQNFTEKYLILKLNFTKPLYVSSFGLRDRLRVGVIANKLFIS